MKKIIRNRGKYFEFLLNFKNEDFYIFILKYYNKLLE